MLNIYDKLKALKQMENYNQIQSLGTIQLKCEGDFIYPDLVLEQYYKYQTWVKTYKPKLP